MNQIEQIRILIVDDHFMVRIGLAQVLNEQSDMTVVAEASNGRQALDLFRQCRPDITLMDVRLPDVDGIQATSAICKEFADAKIIVLTTYSGDQDTLRAIQAGARAYLLKDQPKQQLLETIRTVHAGYVPFPPPVIARLIGRQPRAELTARESEVLQLIVEGLSNKEIGRSLNITEGTVKNHINNLLSKLGVNDRTQAATTAIKLGLARLK